MIKEKIKRFFGIRSPSAAAAKIGNSIAYCFNSGIQKQQCIQCIKVNSIYQPYEIRRAIILPSYGNVEYTVSAFEWTKRELLFDKKKGVQKWDLLTHFQRKKNLQ